MLLVEARYKAVTGSAGSSNAVPQAIGRYNTRLGIDFNSPNGHGERSGRLPGDDRVDASVTLQF